MDEQNLDDSVDYGTNGEVDSQRQSSIAELLEEDSSAQDDENPSLNANF